MHKSTTRTSKDIHTSRLWTRIVVAIIAPVLLITLVGSAFLQQAHQTSGPISGQRGLLPASSGGLAIASLPQATPTPPVLTKEYIYSGGQLVATAEPLVFSDITPANQYYNEIMQIAQAEVTTGNGGAYVPTSPVTREQMAAFIIRALGYYEPPTPGSQRFADVPPSNIFYNFIEQMAVFNITTGCGSGNYCPTQNVTHQEMATFLVRACGVTVPPNPPLATFTDVPPGNLFRDFIGVAGAKNIWSGCGGGNYCPSDNVTREQMAKMLVNNFDLLAPMDHSKASDGNNSTHPRACKWSL